MSTDSSVFHMQQPWGAAQHSSPTPLSSLLRYSVLVPATAGMMPRSESSVAADASASIESADARWNRQMQYVFSRCALATTPVRDLCLPCASRVCAPLTRRVDVCVLAAAL